MLKLAVFLLIATCSYGQSQFNTTLLDHWYQDSLVAASTQMRYNECFGFEIDGREYAVVGSTEGSHFFELSDQNTFLDRGFIEGKYNHPLVVHRDYAIYQNYIYAVCDEGESSLQIIDLSQLGQGNPQLIAENDSIFARVHNIFIDTNEALLYACSITEMNNGTVISDRSMRVFSLVNPSSPSLIYSGPSDIPEVHDCYARDNIAILNCGFDGIRVYNFSNPSSPQLLQSMEFYQDQGYNHQGWLSDDGCNYIFGDETNGKQLKFCSVSNNQVTIENLFGTNWQDESVPHNVQISGKYAFVAYYNEGLRIYDISGNTTVEIAHFDTHPIDEPLFKMRGAWGVHARYKSDRIIVSDRVHGLYLIAFDREPFEPSSNEDLILFPSILAQGEVMTGRLLVDGISEFDIKIVSMDGKLMKDFHVSDQSYWLHEMNYAQGAYNLILTYFNYLGEEQRIIERFAIH